MPDLPSKTLRIADLATRKATHFTLDFTPKHLAALAKDLDILAVKKLTFKGQIEPRGGKDWQLDAELGATVVQACAITSDPVTTRIDEDIRRIYLREMEEIVAAETEMTGDDDAEEIPEHLDLGQVMIEAIRLSLPAFPKIDGAELGQAVFTEPNAAPMTDEDARPFAGLGALKEALEKKGDGGA